MNDVQTRLGARRRLSIIVPVYHEEETLPETIPTLIQLQDRLADTDLDLVFVEDGSTDDSFRVLKSFQEKWPETITIVRLSRNFGSLNAILAGYGLSVADQIPIEHIPNPHNEAYLRAKRDRLGHTLHHQGLALDEEMLREEEQEDRRRMHGE